MSSSSLVTGADRPYLFTQAAGQIKREYGDRVSFEASPRALLKFGRNGAVGTSLATVWQSGAANETLPTTNAIDKFSSSDDTDAVDIKIYGHTVSGTGADAVFTEVVQTVTLAGPAAETETALTTPLARVNRVFVAGATPLVGDVYVYEDDTVVAGVPQTAAKIHAKVVAVDNQTYKAATTTSGTEYLVLSSMYVSGDRSSPTGAVIDASIEVKSPGGIFLPKVGFSVNAADGGVNVFEFDGGIIVPKNSDVRLRVISSDAATVVNGGFQGYYAVVL